MNAMKVLTALILSAAAIPVQAEPVRSGGHGGGNMPALNAQRGAAPKVHPAGAPLYPGYPAAVNVELPDPQVVGRERRQTINCKSTQAREMQNTKNINSQKARTERLDAINKKNAYHGISNSEQSESKIVAGRTSGNVRRRLP